MTVVMFSSVAQRLIADDICPRENAEEIAQFLTQLELNNGAMVRLRHVLDLCSNNIARDDFVDNWLTRYHSEIESCTDCYNYFPCNFEGSEVGGALVCDNCITDYYEWCDSCGEHYPNGDHDGYHDDEDSDGDAFQGRQNEGTLFVAKHERVRSDALFLGVELELEVTHGSDRGNIATRIRDLIGNSFSCTKSDGTVNYGFELVTSPATLAAHKERFEPLFNDWVLQNLDGADNCGMHVHINRKNLSPLILGKLFLMFHNANMYGLIRAVAGRDPYCVSWCKAVPSYTIHDYVERCRWPMRNREKFDNWEFRGDRYEALNLTSDHGTAEVRLFASTTDGDTFFKNLEFVDAAVNFVRAHNPRQITDPDLFMSWVCDHHKEYPYLFAFLHEAKIPTPQEIWQERMGIMICEAMERISDLAGEIMEAQRHYQHVLEGGAQPRPARLRYFNDILRLAGLDMIPESELVTRVLTDAERAWLNERPNMRPVRDCDCANCEVMIAAGRTFRN